MLNVNFNPKRKEIDGNFFVELIQPRGPYISGRDEPEDGCNRLGYWCDELHLLSMIDTISNQIGNQCRDRVYDALTKN